MRRKLHRKQEPFLRKYEERPCSLGRPQFSLGVLCYILYVRLTQWTLSSISTEQGEAPGLIQGDRAACREMIKRKHADI